ncbi:unnamed protein product (macronuclear) [Paramecium tetraurelia]|uniref:PSI domain-containing protein n=1 Tax=Paramecium tetraurelia TaxID=5888 RepID=A0C246_PARTE|nr:uncharacterized protein GSPATT00034340001 [Paramecium tetraurelia]CAK64863.1 unnamed protein product [Paramecium tetraurelia]|eukprot:XP_001432260.1 hypothetical protein (macronuclear) [Paramecium tetraurelia strain d4-2]
MSKLFILFSLILTLVTSQEFSITQCTCAQLLSEEDCRKNVSFRCTWDRIKRVCAISTTSALMYETYCDTFAEVDCPKAKPCTDCGNYAACAWGLGKCTFFTGCTAFSKTLMLNVKQQVIDVLQMELIVLKLMPAAHTKNSSACVKNAAGRLCYWDTTNNTCVDANTCDKLPASFATDKECRDVISTCTTKTGGGCVDSGNIVVIKHQKFNVYGINQNLLHVIGMELICNNAPATLTTDDTCKLFRTDGTCTTKANGGCVTRTTCAAATIQAACVKNSSNGDCYWTGIVCIVKTCKNAPTTMITNTACGGFVTGCITKLGGGCVTNGPCSAANVQAACVKNTSGTDCIWDTTCKEKTCVNAPTTNNTHELCTSYLSTCTVKAGGGCQPRTCANAPTTITTNDACEAYLPNNNCITKTAGGCVINTTCAVITLEAACIKNSSGATCFWDTASLACKDRKCTNAPSSNNTHDLCVAFLSTCTVNSTNAGCVDKSCENSLVQTICDKDLNNKACIWKGKCYKKECVLASSTTATHEDCQTYDSGCTLSNTGTGCVPLPLKCEAITIEAACNIKLQITNGVKSYPECGWNGSQCIDKACSTAPKTTATTADCGTYKANCVTNNPVNGSIAGCQDLPTTCAARKSTENCEITRVGFPTCLWNTATLACVEKSCATANVVGLQVVVQAGLFTFNHCRNYLSNCISNNNQDGCIPKPSSCSKLNSQNCQMGSKINGNCYWNGHNCVDRTCKNFALITHIGCQTILDICTVNNGNTGCQILANNCNSYRQQENCIITLNKNKCIWTGVDCRNATCQDASDNNLYDSDSECSNYSIINETCTVLYKTGGQGCVKRSTYCSDYVSAAQCYRTLAAISDDCTWKSAYSKCFSNTYLQGACSKFTGTKTQCESIKTGCTNTVGATETDICTFSCALVSETTHANCQGYSTTCTVNKAANACQIAQASCAGYGTTQSSCSYRTDGLKCHLDFTAPTPTCVDITSANCSLITVLNGGAEVEAACQAYNTACHINGTPDGCQEFQATCAGYGTTQANCSYRIDGLKCHWDATAPTPTCVDITSANCYLITDLIHEAAVEGTCQVYNTACHINGTPNGCQAWHIPCTAYGTTEANCTKRTDGLKCYWDTTATTPTCVDITSANCNLLTGLSSPNNTHANCQAHSTACTINKALGACQAVQATCVGYATIEVNCSFRTDGLKCHWDATATTPTCLDITSANCNLITSLTSPNNVEATCQAYSTSCHINAGVTACFAFTTCEAITGTNITWAICQGYSTTCSVKRDGSGCVTIQSQCSGYKTIENCYRSTAGYCTANSTDTICQPITESTACETIKLGLGFTFSDVKCNQLRAGCITQGTTGCQTRTCANKTTPFAHTDCNGWLNTCTANAASSPTACVTLPTTCASQTAAACVWAVEGECAVSGTSCVRKTCDTATADTSFDTHAECISYLSTCTVVRIGGCQARAACSAYKSSQQCKFNKSGGKCFWNPTNKTCVDLNCGNIEATTSYDTHAECVAVDTNLLCTVRAANWAAVPGCTARGACSSYSIEDQCKTNASAGVCVWNTNLTTPVCQDKSCTTAPTATATHADCDAYFSTVTIKCTVVATPDTNGGAPVLGGCQQTAACSTYIHQEQCEFNATGDPCGWNGTQCADKSCATAPATADYDDNDKCRAYFNNKCTVASTGQGCVDIPDTCETMTEKQCVTDKTARSCYWNGTACITRSCENAPEATSSAEDCNTYLSGCTSDSVKCKTKVCEDFAFATDALCKSALSTCTTNGTNCVTRGTCFQALSQAGCVTSVTNQQCEWMPVVGTNPAYCTIKTCNTAPVTLTSEAACAGYFTNCTTKNGGGCVTKSTCAAVTIDAACTTALNGTVCAWDSAQMEPLMLHAKPKELDALLVPMENVQEIQNCEQTTIRSACIEGTNGPCLWINDYVNTDGSKGACFRYTSCKSLNWNSDTSCKWISNQCTTNGSNCVGITLCSETNTDGGCVTGYDGACIQSVPALNSSDPKVCKPYTSCADAFYTTHSDCQIASKKCTTNGTTGCIALGACSSYTTQAGCYFNDKGVVLTSGAITSTGICTWDTTASSCRDQSCADLTGTTHATCSSQLSTCTSDGTTCLIKGACSSYTTQTACTTAVGSDGICYWELASATNNNTAKCRLMTCADIQNGTSTNVCSVALSSCVSNGTACISKANCSTYTTKTACNSGGLDGICVFTQSTAAGAAAGTGTCALMTACTIANNDQLACQAAKDRCSWTAASGTGTTAVASKCATHTCATNQATNGACTRFLNWDKKTQQICTLVSGTCTATDPSTLSLNDCFLVSGYTYTWNASTSKCGVCTAVVVYPNNTDNNTNNTNNETITDSGYILGLSAIVFGYLMF